MRRLETPLITRDRRRRVATAPGHRAACAFDEGRQSGLVLGGGVVQGRSPIGLRALRVLHRLQAGEPGRCHPLAGGIARTLKVPQGLAQRQRAVLALLVAQGGVEQCRVTQALRVLGKAGPRGRDVAVDFIQAVEQQRRFTTHQRQTGLQMGLGRAGLQRVRVAKRCLGVALAQPPGQLEGCVGGACGVAPGVGQHGLGLLDRGAAAEEVNVVCVGAGHGVSMGDQAMLAAPARGPPPINSGAMLDPS